MTKQTILRLILATIGALSAITSEYLVLEMPVFSIWWTLLEVVLLFGGLFLIFLAAILPFVECQVEEPDGGGYE